MEWNGMEGKKLRKWWEKIIHTLPLLIERARGDIIILKNHIFWAATVSNDNYINNNINYNIHNNVNNNIHHSINNNINKNIYHNVNNNVSISNDKRKNKSNYDNDFQTTIKCVYMLTALMASFKMVTAHSASPSLSQLLMSTDRPNSSIWEATTCNEVK